MSAAAVLPLVPKIPSLTVAARAPRACGRRAFVDLLIARGAVRVLVRALRPAAEAARGRLRRHRRADRRGHGRVRRREPGRDPAHRRRSMKRLGCRRTMIARHLAAGRVGARLHAASTAPAWLAARAARLQGIAWSLFFAAGMSMVADVAPRGAARSRHRPVRRRGAGHERARPRRRGADRGALRARARCSCSPRCRAGRAPGICRRLSAGAAGRRRRPAAEPASAGRRAARAIVFARAGDRRAGGRHRVHVRGAVRARARDRARARLLHRVHADRARRAHRRPRA